MFVQIGFRRGVPSFRGASDIFGGTPAVVGCFSRRALAWLLPNTMAVIFCVEAVEEALARRHRSDISKTARASGPIGRPMAGLPSTRCIASARTTTDRGGTASPSNGSGARSDTRKSACLAMTGSTRRACRSGNISGLAATENCVRPLTVAGPSLFRQPPAFDGGPNFAAELRRRSSRATPFPRDTQIGTAQGQTAADPLFQRRSLFRRGRPPFGALALERELRSDVS
jgi:hypothetical protein